MGSGMINVAPLLIMVMSVKQLNVSSVRLNLYFDNKVLSYSDAFVMDKSN